MKPLFLSQLNAPYEMALQRGLRTSYDWHRWIWGAFPGQPDKKRDFLFRVDTEDRSVRVLLLSGERPSSEGREWEWQTRVVSCDFLGQGAYRFQVRANPTFRRASDHRRLALCREDDLRNWIARKLECMGAKIHALDVGHPHEEAFVKDGRRGVHKVVEFRGVLAVSDMSLFCEGFRNGIGSAKGFGYGMLMLLPVQL